MFNNIGLPGLLLIAVVVLVLFGRGKVSNLMGEVGKGISSFKKGVREGTDELEREGEEPAVRRTISETTVRPVVPGQEARDITPHTSDRV